MNKKEMVAAFKKKFPRAIVDGYYIVDEGIVILTQSLFGRIECNYYLVNKNGNIVPTTPMLVDIDPDKLYKL